MLEVKPLRKGFIDDYAPHRGQPFRVPNVFPFKATKLSIGQLAKICGLKYQDGKVG